MKTALGMIEFKTVASGITAADRMLKTVEVEIVQANPVCPGKYIAAIAGELSSVKAAIDTAEAMAPDMLIDRFILGNPHESVQPAISGVNPVTQRGAIGVIETFTAASAVVAADTAAKTAVVDLIEVRLAKGMCGKSYVILTGSVSSVTAAVERAAQDMDPANLLDTTVIAGPDSRLWDSIL